MPKDTHFDPSLNWARAGAVEPVDGGASDSLGWWLIGGVSLLAWTGLALLLTVA